jgi:deferrochelatase/peroxidase EfeB
MAIPTKKGLPANMPQPEIVSRNGSYVAYLRMQERVGAFRDFLREYGQTTEQQEWIAAKLMGRWRSGSPLVLAPKKDDPELGADTSDTTTSMMELWTPSVTAGAFVLWPYSR